MPAPIRTRRPATTIKTRLPTAEKLRLLRDGYRFTSLNELLEYLATLALQRPDLMREPAPVDGRIPDL